MDSGCIDEDGTPLKPAMDKRFVLYTEKVERVNIMMAAQFARMPQMKELYYRNRSYSVWLQLFAQRAFDIVDGVGSVHVWYWESANELQLPGRRYSGLRAEGAKPRLPYTETLVPADARCMSPFMLPSALKDILRMGLDLDDLDLSISHLQMFARRMKIPFDATTVIGKLVTNTEALRLELVQSEYGKIAGAQAAKKLPIALLNGREVLPQGVPAWVEVYSKEVDVLRARERVENAALLAKLKKRRHPDRTLTSRLNEAEERAVIDFLELRCKRLGKDVVAFEHDGIVGLQLAQHLATFGAAGIFLKNKKGPQTPAEWMKDYGMEVDLPEPSADLIGRLLNDPLVRGIMSLESRFVDHHSFATFISQELRRVYDFPQFVIDRASAENVVIQYWHEAKANWIPAGGARALRDACPEILREAFRNCAVQPQDIGGLLGNFNFLKDITEMTKALLPVQSEPGIGLLDDVEAQGKLRFACGTVMDFKTKEIRRGRPSDRMSFSTKEPYAEWKSASVEALIRDLQLLWDKEEEVEPDSDLEKRLQAEVAKEGVYSLFFNLFEHHNQGLWMLRQVARGLAGLQNLEEFVFLYDPRGKNGKGTIMALVIETLGLGSENYYKSIEYAVLKGRTDGGNDPKMDAARGKRVVSCNEAFKKKDAVMEFDTNVIKALCSNDEPLETMGKYVAPRMWKGQALVILSSNCMIGMPQGDGGTSSRLALVRMPFTFVKGEPQGATERTIDPEIKAIKVPLMVPEFVFWAFHLNHGLWKQKITDRVLQPRPAKIASDTAQLFGEDDPQARREALKTFLADKCDSAGPDTTSTTGLQPSSMKEFEDAVYTYLRAIVLAGAPFTMPEDIQEFLRQELVLVMMDGRKTVKVGGKCLRSFYKAKDIRGKPFETALRVKP